MIRSVDWALAHARLTPRQIWRILALVAGVALAGAVVDLSHPGEIGESLEQLDPFSLVTAVLLNVPVVVLRTWRAQLVVHHLGYGISFRAMLPVQLVGQTSSSLTPAASGDYIRAYLWRRGHGTPLRVGAAAVTFERLYSFLLLIAVAILLITLPRHGWWGWIGVAGGLAAVSLAPLLAARVPAGMEERMLERVLRGRPAGRLADGAQGLLVHLRALVASPVLLVKTSFLTLAVFVLSGVQIRLLLAGIGPTIPMTQAVAVYTTSQVGGIVSALPFGIGTADITVVTVLAGYGVTVIDAATLALVVRGVATLPQALAGLVAYFSVGMSRAVPLADPGAVEPVPDPVAEVR